MCVDPESFKNIMRRYPTGITIVTAYLDRKPYGATVNSFTSVSLKPPLIGIFLGNNSRILKAVLESNGYCVNILNSAQSTLAERFAFKPGEERFDHVKWFRNKSGFPVIDGSIAYLSTRIWRTYEIADHTLIVGEVIDADILSDVKPLIYYMRGYREIC